MLKPFASLRAMPNFAILRLKGAASNGAALRDTHDAPPVMRHPSCATHRRYQARYIEARRGDTPLITVASSGKQRQIQVAANSSSGELLNEHDPGIMQENTHAASSS
jgi:hypothetical protein